MIISALCYKLSICIKQLCAVGKQGNKRALLRRSGCCHLLYFPTIQKADTALVSQRYLMNDKTSVYIGWRPMKAEGTTLNIQSVTRLSGSKRGKKSNLNIYHIIIQYSHSAFIPNTKTPDFICLRFSASSCRVWGNLNKKCSQRSVNA